jgi:hypothetical protein
MKPDSWFKLGLLSWLFQVPGYILTVYVSNVLLILALWALFLASLVTYPLSVGRLGSTMRAKDFPVGGWSDAGGMVVLIAAVPFLGSTASLLLFVPMGLRNRLSG